MLRSMFAGVSGLKVHQTKMDVIGNNIANVNTTGFKSSRVSFSEALNQTLQTASSPSKTRAGLNPQQVGLGVRLGTIDVIHTQGPTQSTGNATDLAIEGNGFFILSDGQKEYFSRAGMFDFDETGHLFCKATGLRVQGILANADGILPESIDQVENIKIAINDIVPPRATDMITFGGNLDARVKMAATTKVFSGELYDLNFSNSPQVLSVIVSGSNNDQPQRILLNKDYATPDQLLDDINSRLQGARAAFEDNKLVISHNNPGAETIIFEEIDDRDLVLGAWQVSTGIDGSQSALKGSVALTSDLDLSSVTDPELRVTIDGNDIVISFSETTYTVQDLLDAINNELIGATAGLDQDGFLVITSDDVGEIDISVSGNMVAQVFDTTQLTTGISATQTTLVGDRALNIDFSNNPAIIQINGFRIVLDQDYSQTGGIANLQDAINLQLQGSSLTASVDGNGFLTIVSDFAGSGYDIQVADAITPDIFGTDPLTEIGRDADEGVNVTRTVVIYDSLGSSHRINVTFSKIGDNEWSWTATLPNDPNTILGSDRLVFDTSGAVISGGKGTITIPADAIEPKLAKDITMEIHLGDLTQFGESTSVVLRNQNGLPSGALDSIAIDRSGIIIGSFSNGMTKNLAQVALARFDNPAGLLKAGNSIFQESNNSGQRVFGRAESGGYGSIMSNALEMSNVDLSEEFTDMIITQRGFQANSRIITSSDEMLQEVVNLKR